MNDINQLKKALKEEGTLSTVLKPEDFAPKDKVADTIGKNLSKVTQLRRVFTTVRQIERSCRGEDKAKELSGEIKTRLTLLEPNLAYAVGRDLLPRNLYEVMELCLKSDKMRTVGDLTRLGEFLAAVVAYQKFHHPKS